MPGPDPAAETQGGGGSAAAPRTMSYQDLRKMAEAAASFRGKEFWMVIGPEGWEARTEEPEPGPDHVAIRCRNDPTAARPEVTRAELGTSAVAKADLLRLKVGGREERADAVFWSAAAVEKFLVPYYASVYGNQAAPEIAKLVQVLDSPPVGGGEGDPAGASPDAFALAHIPRSEYVKVDGGIAVLSPGPTGVVVSSVGEHAERLQRRARERKSGSRAT
jgi:hypothetical protein